MTHYKREMHSIFVVSNTFACVCQYD